MQKFAVIFDFNGTMLFDTPLQFHAWDELAKETLGHGIPWEEFIRCTNGRTSSETVAYFWGDGLQKQEQKALIRRKRELYQQQCLAHPEEFHLAEGIPEVLDMLKQKSVSFTIATSSNPQSVDFYFAHLDLGKWFDRERVICSDQKFPGKPAPDIYRIAAERLGIPPARCIVVEDALAGAIAARSAGVGYVIVIDPDNTGAIWVGDEVDYVIHAHSELNEILCNIMHAFEADAP